MCFASCKFSVCHFSFSTLQSSLAQNIGLRLGRMGVILRTAKWTKSYESHLECIGDLQEVLQNTVLRCSALSNADPRWLSWAGVGRVAISPHRDEQPRCKKLSSIMSESATTSHSTRMYHDSLHSLNTASFSDYISRHLRTTLLGAGSP